MTGHVHRSAAETAAAVRAGTLTPEDAVASALGRIAAHDEQLGAFQVVRAQAALAEAAAVGVRADLATLPLAGVPVAIKDNIPVAGEPMRIGSNATPAAPQDHDHEVVRRLRAAGAVVVGLTRVPELGIFAATDSQFGITRNPWDAARTAGGSSGGSAAAVSSGMVPVAHGNDGMGSIRIPAACCGLVGLKPGFGVVPAGISSNDWYDMVVNGALTTTVGDAALMLSVLADRPDLALVSEPTRTLRVAVSWRPPVSGVSPDREHLRAVARTARLLAGAGHGIAKADPPYPANPMPALARYFAGAAVEAEGLDRSGMDRAVRGHLALGDVALSRGLVRDEDRERLRTAMEGFFAGYDVLLLPVLATPPIEAARWGQRPWPRTMLANTRFAPYAAMWNVIGFPAIAVPAGVHPTTGTPLAVQLVAPDGGEGLMLSVAAQLERLAPWPRTAPGY